MAHEKSESYLKKYSDRMYESIHLLQPDWDEERVRKVIKKKMKDQGTNPYVHMENNFTGETQDASLLSVFDWSLAAKPILAGNGTFYKNQYEAINPVAQMLDGMLIERKNIKKKMFKVEDDESEEYKDLDRAQKNSKININSYYGGSGAPSSAFFSEFSGAATTLGAQMVISTTETTFEGFVADNFEFIDINEFFDWLSSFLPNAPLILDPWVKEVSEEQLYERLRGKFVKLKKQDKETLRRFVSQLDSLDRKLIYYKDNLIQFVEDHKYVKNLYESIFEGVINLPYFEEHDDWRTSIKKMGYGDSGYKKVDDWNKFVNKEYFMDPNALPETISDRVIKLNSLFMEYVYVPYVPFERVYRLKNFKRKTVTVIDTDSNILALDTWVNYSLKNVLKESYGRDNMKNVFIAVNTLTYSITKVVTDILLKFGENSNVPEEFRGRLNMKNEFLFSKLVIGKTKKRYLSKVILREGNFFKKPKTDIKGFDFVKATTSRESEAVFKRLIDDYIMGDTIDTKSLMSEVYAYANEIQQSIQSGDIEKLPNTSAKELSAYKDPASEQSVRGVLTWNMVYPNNEIDVPSKVKILKLKIYTEEQLEPIRLSHPDVYDVLKEKIFHDTTGIFVSYKDDVDKKTGAMKKIKKERGCVVLCIPTNKKIPDWCMPFIDYNVMIDNILAPFKSVTSILGIKNLSVGKTINGTTRKSEKISNIIRF